MKPTYEEIEQQLSESRREFRAADATIHNLELKLTGMAEQLNNAESKCAALAAENEVLKSCVDGWCDMPATDACLAEVRAQGVEAFVMDFTEPAVMNNGVFYSGDLVEASNEFAAQSRQGVEK